MKAVIVRQDIPGLAIAALIGLALTIIGSVKFKYALDTKKWPVVKGRITLSEVGGSMKYFPSVSYSYVVDSVLFNSNRISDVSFNTKNRSVAEDVLKKYPAGAEVNVHYDSSEPSSSFLEPGPNTGNYLLLAFGVFVLLIPVFLLLFMQVDLKKGS